MSRSGRLGFDLRTDANGRKFYSLTVTAHFPRDPSLWTALEVRGKQWNCLNFCLNYCHFGP